MSNDCRWCHTLAMTLFIVLGSQTTQSASSSGIQQKIFNFLPPCSQFVATLSGGILWESAGKTQTFYLIPEVEKTYAASHSSHSAPYGEIFLGIQNPLYKKLQGQIGFAIADTSNAALSGNIWDDADPAFNNFTYYYQAKHTSYSLKGKLLADMGYTLIPWVSGSLGVGVNQAHNFSSTPTIFEAVPTPGFSGHTTTSFTYTLGIGVELPMTPNWHAGIGYEFSDWGKTQLDRAFGQTIGHGLSLDHFYTNGLLLNISYIA